MKCTSQYLHDSWLQLRIHNVIKCAAALFGPSVRSNTSEHADLHIQPFWVKSSSTKIKVRPRGASVSQSLRKSRKSSQKLGLPNRLVKGQCMGTASNDSTMSPQRCLFKLWYGSAHQRAHS